MDTCIIRLSGTFEDWESNIRLVSDIYFTDPVSEKNYYLIYVFLSHNDKKAQPMEFSCNDPVVEEELNHGKIKFGVAFSDMTINGKQHRLTVTLNGKHIGRPFFGSDPPGFPSYKTVIYFRLYSITDEYFRYIQTLNLFLRITETHWLKQFRYIQILKVDMGYLPERPFHQIQLYLIIKMTV